MRASISKYFFGGYRRTLSLGGKKEWSDIYGDRTKDYNALRSDWCNVGNVIREGVGDMSGKTNFKEEIFG